MVHMQPVRASSVLSDLEALAPKICAPRAQLHQAASLAAQASLHDTEVRADVSPSLWPLPVAESRERSVT